MLIKLFTYSTKSCRKLILWILIAYFLSMRACLLKCLVKAASSQCSTIITPSISRLIINCREISTLNTLHFCSFFLIAVNYVDGKD